MDELNQEELNIDSRKNMPERKSNGLVWCITPAAVFKRDDDRYNIIPVQSIPHDFVFDTKTEAIDAMISRLKAMKNEI